MRSIDELLQKMGIGARYRGYWYSLEAIRMAMENPERLLSTKKQIYEPIAEQYHTSWENVERSIRTIIKVYWNRGNHAILEAIAGRELEYKPTVCEFIDIVSVYFLRLEKDLPSA